MGVEDTILHRSAALNKVETDVNSMISMKYTRDNLIGILQEGGASVLEEYREYTQRLRVKFRCSCGAETSKRFEMLYMYRYPYCEACSLKKKAEKCKETCMEKYGVSNAGKLPEVIEKIKDIWDTKFGGHPKKTKEVQDKWKATCLDKYG